MKLKDLLKKLLELIFADATSASDGGTTHGDGNAPAPEQDTDAVATTVGESKQTNNPPSATTDAAPAILRFDVGGVRASPTEDPACRISSLRMTSGGLSFHWDSDIPATWKRGQTAKGPMVLACAFYWNDARAAWVGGKFDWIDRQRAARSFENIRDGYHGWNPEAFFGARRRAFCVMSADGRRRSNLLETD